MINPADLVDHLVAMLRDIPELVAEMNGDSERIFAYRRQELEKRFGAEQVHGEIGVAEGELFGTSEHLGQMVGECCQVDRSVEPIAHHNAD